MDTKHNLIAEQQVHNKVSDRGLLTITAEAAMKALGVDHIDVVADGGYFAIEDIQACTAASISPYFPKPNRSPAAQKGLFTKEQFCFNAETNSYTWPGGEILVALHRRKIRDTAYAVNYGNRQACKSCSLKDQCTEAEYRKVARYENEEVLEDMASRLKSRPGILDQRRNSVEHPFGSIKQWMNQGVFLMRKLENVRGEFSLTALAYNLRRAINLVGVSGCELDISKHAE